MVRKIVLLFGFLCIGNGVIFCTSSNSKDSKSLNIAKRTAKVGAYSLISAASVVVAAEAMYAQYYQTLHMIGYLANRYNKPYNRMCQSKEQITAEFLMYSICRVATIIGAYEVIKKYSAKVKAAYNGDNQSSKPVEQNPPF